MSALSIPTRSEGRVDNPLSSVRLTGSREDLHPEGTERLHGEV